MKKFTILSIALAMASIAKAQVLTLDSCVQMALRNNREIKASQIRIQEQQNMEKAYKANFYPNITANGTYLNAFNNFEFKTDLTNLIPNSLRPHMAELGEVMVGTIYKANPQLAQQLATADTKLSLKYDFQNIYAFGVTLKQPIYMGGKITAAHQMSKLGTQMARANEKMTREQVIVQTNEAYSLLLKAKEMHKVALQYDSLLHQLMADVEGAERHGLRGHNDVLKVQVKKNESELQLLQAQNGIQLAKMNLCHYIGIPLSTDIEIADLSSPQTQQAASTATIITRPEYNLLELKNEMARQKIKLARSEHLPQLGVQLSSVYMHGGELLGSTLLDNKAPSTMGVVSLSVPIWHGNESKHKINAAKKEYERTVQEQQELIDKMNLELQQCANVLNESIVELELANKSVEQATENLRNSRRSFDVGLESLSDLLEAQTLWQQACAKKAIAESQLIVNRVKYQKACGQL